MTHNKTSRFYFILIRTCVFGGAHVWGCVYECRHTWKPEEQVRSQAPGVTGSVSQLSHTLRTKAILLKNWRYSQPLSPLSSPVQLSLGPGYSFLKRPGEVRPQSLPNTWEAIPAVSFRTIPLTLSSSPAPLHSSLLEGFIVLLPLSQKS